MDYLDEGVVKVKKFHLDDDSSKAGYEAVLNDINCTVIRDEFTYDKAGRAIITI